MDIQKRSLISRFCECHGVWSACGWVGRVMVLSACGWVGRVTVLSTCGWVGCVTVFAELSTCRGWVESVTVLSACGWVGRVTVLSAYGWVGRSRCCPLVGGMGVSRYRPLAGGLGVSRLWVGWACHGVVHLQGVGWECPRVPLWLAQSTRNPPPDSHRRQRQHPGQSDQHT